MAESYRTPETAQALSSQMAGLGAILLLGDRRQPQAQDVPLGAALPLVLEQQLEEPALQLLGVIEVEVELVPPGRENRRCLRIQARIVPLGRDRRLNLQPAARIAVDPRTPHAHALAAGAHHILAQELLEVAVSLCQCRLEGRGRGHLEGDEERIRHCLVEANRLTLPPDTPDLHEEALREQAPDPGEDRVRLLARFAGCLANA